MKKTSNELIRGPQTVNISEGFGGVTAPGLKALASADKNLSSRGGDWRQFVGPQCLLGKAGHSLGVWQARCLQPDGDCQIPYVC